MTNPEIACAAMLAAFCFVALLSVITIWNAPLTDSKRRPAQAAKQAPTPPKNNENRPQQGNIRALDHEPAPEDCDAEEKEHRRKERRYWNGQNVGVFLFLLAAWGAVASAIYTKGAMIAGQGQLNALIAAQRPFVNISSIARTNYLEYVKYLPIFVRISIVNGGQTVAFHLTVQSDCNETGEFVFTLPPDHAPVSPREDVSLRGCRIPQGKMLPAVGGHWFIFGQIKYRDAFNLPYLTEYCREINFYPTTGQLNEATGLDSAGNVPGDTNFCVGKLAEHNCMDQDCQDWTKVYPADHGTLPPVAAQ